MAARAPVREVDGTPAVGTAGGCGHTHPLGTCPCLTVVDRGEREGERRGKREGERRREARPT